MPRDSLPTDEELFSAVKTNDMAAFTTKSNSTFVSQLRFTDTLYNILHLCVYYQRREMVAALLEMPSTPQLINGKDRNGETPLHLACFHTNLDITLNLLNKGASLTSRNIYGKDPIDIIQVYSKRKKFIIDLINKRPKMHIKETDLLKMHRRQCVYLEAMAEIIFASDNRHQFKIDRGLIEAHTDRQPTPQLYRNRVDHMEQLREFKIGLRPHEEFFFKTSNDIQFEAENKENNKKFSPNFGRSQKKPTQKSSFIKNSNIGSVINMNNYVSSKNFDFNDVPQGMAHDEAQLEEQFRSMKQSFIDPKIGNQLSKDTSFSQFPASKQSKFHNNYQSRILTPQKKFDNMSQDSGPEEPNLFLDTPKQVARNVSENKIPKFNYVNTTKRNHHMIRQNRDQEENGGPILLNYHTVKDSSYEPNKSPKRAPKLRNGSSIRQQRDNNEEYPPHSSKNTSARGSRIGNGVYRGHLMDDSTNRHHQTSHQFVIKESPEYENNDTRFSGDSEDPYKTIGQQERFAGSRIRQNHAINNDPYKTYKPGNTIQSEYMTMNMDNDNQTSGQKMKDSMFFDKLNQFDRRKDSYQASLGNSRAVKIDKSASGNKNERFKFLQVKMNLLNYLITFYLFPSFLFYPSFVGLPLPQEHHQLSIFLPKRQGPLLASFPN